MKYTVFLFVFCKIYAPGIGIGLIVAHVSSTRHNFQYKVQVLSGGKCCTIFASFVYIFTVVLITNGCNTLSIYQFIFSFLFVKMADGRNIVVAVRRCEKCDSDVVSSNLNPRIFIMQRLYGG